jgi:hypothetical protein
MNEVEEQSLRIRPNPRDHTRFADYLTNIIHANHFVRWKRWAFLSVVSLSLSLKKIETKTINARAILWASGFELRMKGVSEKGISNQRETSFRVLEWVGLRLTLV